MSEKCVEMEQPPSRDKMGLMQILQIVIMGVTVILHIFDMFIMILAKLSHYSLTIEFICDILVSAVLIFMIVGFFATPCTRFVKFAIFGYFVLCVVDVIFFIWIWFKAVDNVGLYVGLNIIKLILTGFLAYLFARQLKNC